jgi:acetate kinase
MLHKPVEQTHLIICHLGSGCSITAVDGGRSVATTMGFTPIEGLMMATRSGSVDPGLLLYVINHKGIDAKQLVDVLNKESGLKGISGISGDLRDILAARASGNERADLAFEMYNAHLQQGIGMMLTALSGLDAIVFTDGVAEHSAEVRTAVLKPLQWLGVQLDETVNKQASPDADIATPDSKARVLIIHNREELIIYRETRRVLEVSLKQV